MGAIESRPDHQGSASPAGQDARQDALSAWLAGLFGHRRFDVTTASADASFRRYFRVTCGDDTFIAMDAPPDREDVRPFIRVAEQLVALGINAPRIHERDLARGFLLLADLGSRTYLAALADRGRAGELYDDAITALVRMQAGGMAFAETLPPYDTALLTREMQLFPDWFLGRHLGLGSGITGSPVLEQAFALLTEAALAQPRVFVHRDYHSRNLMVCDGGREGANPGVLDFQDAVAGPVTYDLVSLLKDCYIAWPAPAVAAWIDRYRGLALAEGLDAGPDAATFRRWFDWMGVQRHLKAIGIFARLWHRDGKPGYLADIPRTLGYVTETAGRYEELEALGRLLVQTVVPALDAVPGPSR